MAKKIELLHTTYDESGNIESQEVVHPLTSPNCIIMENGKTLDEVMGDGIATPTLTHEGTSFKVGVGDSNIEVVDGDVASMTLKGQSYQNILPKPTTLIMETDEKEFKINDKIDSNIIIDDNIAEIATVKGLTYVNTVQEESGSEYTVLGEDLSGQSIAHVKETPTLDGNTLVNLLTPRLIGALNATHTINNGTISVTSTKELSWCSITLAISPLKQNTEYIVLLEDYSFTHPSSLGSTIGVYVQDGNINLGSLVQGANHFRFNTRDYNVDGDSIGIRIHAATSVALMGATTTVRNVRVLEYQEGMENWDIPYFEGEKYFESNIKGITLQGQTLVNTIQEPCKDNYVVLGADDGIEISAETGGCGTIEDTVQGGINGAVLEGQTLVNIVSECWFSGVSTSDGTDKSNVTATSNTNQTWASINFRVKPSLYKQNTDYIAMWDDIVGDTPYKLVKTYDETSTALPKSQTGLQHQVTTYGGKNFIVFNTGDCTTSLNIRIHFTNTTVSETRHTLAVKNMKVMEYQEGMENWDIPYFEGMKSVQMPVLTTTGKNLFDGELQTGFVSTTGAFFNDTTKVCSSNFNKISSNTNYILKRFDGVNGLRLVWYDENYDFISVRNSSSGTYITTTSPSNAKYFKIGLENTTDTSINVQFEEGTQVTSYEPYKSNILTVNEDVELRGIGDVRDELDLQTGKLTQRIGEMVLDGSEDWRSTTFDYLPNNFTANIPILNHLNDTNSKGMRALVKDNKGFTNNCVSATVNDSRMNGKKGFSIHNNGNIYFTLPLTECANLTQWKEQLASQPLVVQYAIKPTIKTIDLQVTNQNGNTISHIKTQPTVTHITASSDYLIPTVTIDNNLSYETIIKPSTLYTVRFKHDTVNADNPLTVDLGGTTQTVTSTEFTITTPSTLTHNQLVFSGKNNVVSEVQVIEGDVTSIEYPFFEGMSDVKFSDSKFITRGKNLFNFENGGQINGLTFSNNGAKNYTVNGTCTKDNTDFYVLSRDKNNGTFTRLNSLPVGTTITVSKSSSVGRRVYLSITQKDGSPTKYVQTYTTTNNDNVIHCFVRFMNGDTFDNAQLNLQIEIGSTATSYEPYKGVEVQQDLDSILLTSSMFEQGKRERGVGMSLQQCPLTNNSARISSKTLIPVKPNSKYVVQGIDTSVNHVWADMYNKDGLVCYNSVYDLTGKATQVPHDVYYLLLQVKNADESAITPSDLDSTNLILQEVPQEIVLRGIGDVKDELDLTRGEYIQRIGEISFNNNNIKEWRTYETRNEYSIAKYSLPHYINGRGEIPSTKLLCDKMKVATINEESAQEQVCAFHHTIGNPPYSEVRICVPNSKLVTADIHGVQAYILDNPFIIQYELATPIIHKVNLTNAKLIQSYATETHYETVTPSDSLIPNITIPSTLNYDVAIKPSTEYTIRANTSDNLTVDLGGTTGTLSNGKVTLTTPATLTHNEVKFSGTGKVKELMVVEGNEIKDNVPFFNGMKNVQMGGIKLVNIARGMTLTGADVLSINTNKTQITYNGTVNAFRVVKFDSTLLKPNTVYTIYLNITENTSTLTNPIKFLYDNDNAFVDFGGTGIKKVVVTTPDVLRGRIEMAFRPCTTSQKIIVQNPMIIEGDWTHLDEIPFIESEMIIEQPIIRSQGKNLLDLESKPFTVASTGTTFTKSGNTYTVTTLANSETYDYIRMTWTLADDKWLRDVIGKQLTLSASSFSCTNKNSEARIQLRIECYDGKKHYIAIALGEKGRTFTMPTNTKDLQLQIMTNNTGTVLTEDTVLTISNIQLELGDTATPYEPYKHQTLYSNRVIGYEENCYYDYRNGNKESNANYNSVIADVEGLSVAYVTNGSSNYSFFDKDGVFISGKAFLDTSLSLGDKNGFITVPTNAKYMKFASSCVANVNTDYTKATVTGDLPLRSLPNGVCDTLNLVTGEYVQRVGEVVLDGSEDWFIHTDNGKQTNTILLRVESLMDVLPLPSSENYNDNNLYCSQLQVRSSDTLWANDIEGISKAQSSRYLRVRINREKLKTQDVDGFKQYLQQNPITVQYELVTPVVRKLGFTTKGNYREQVLDGSETWAMDAIDNNKTVRMTKKTVSPLQNPLYNTVLFTDDYHVRATGENHSTYEYITCIGNGIYINIYQSKVNELSVQGCTQWLGQNPIKVGYITSTQSSESYSNIHKPIFFNNVDVQYLPNNVDIQPELTYQVRTRNSYVMDMMKANTKYSVKLLLNTGEFVPTIDGVNNPLVNGRTFTSPSTLTNKLLITPSIKELMIIEGDVTGKNLPYFKGILSSYHDVDEIELYSVNKNLFDMSKVKPYDETGAHWWNTIIKENEVVSVRSGNIEAGQFGAYATLDIRPNSVYTLYIEMEKDGEPFNGQIYVYENDKVWGNGTFTGYANTMYHLRTSQNAKYITIGLNYGKDFPIGTTFVSKNMRLYLGEESPVYIPHSHNTTLIEMPTRLETVKVVKPVMENGSINSGTGANYDDGDSLVKNVRTKDYLPVQPGEIIKFYNNGQGRAVNMNYYDINKQFVKYEFYDGVSTRPTVPKDCYFVRMYCGKSACSDITLTRQAWKPIQLNSLPNGVCDEIIMKPNSNKAQLVQRVGKVVLNDKDWSQDISFSADIDLLEFITHIENLQRVSLCNNFIVYGSKERIVNANNTVYVRILKTKASSLSDFKEYLTKNPTTLYYELATPIIHEIQLKGYPHVYENGTVTLNTDTPHQTLVSYNVNQEQLISTQNETIIRHDQQIDDLYYYIEMYLEEIYQMELFRMKLELSL